MDTSFAAMQEEANLARIAALDLHPKLHKENVFDSHVYACNLCVRDMFGYKRFVLHHITEEHQSHARASATKKEINRMYASAPINQLAEKCESRTDGLLGLEYIIEVHLSRQGPVYLCRMCNALKSPAYILSHVTSQQHRQNYLENNFPHVLSQLQPYLRLYNENDGEALLDYVCDMMDRQYGRLHSYAVHVKDLYRFEACYGSVLHLRHENAAYYRNTYIRDDHILEMLAGQRPFAKLTVDCDTPSVIDGYQPLLMMADKQLYEGDAPTDGLASLVPKDATMVSNPGKIFEYLLECRRKELGRKRDEYLEEPRKHPQHDIHLIHFAQSYPPSTRDWPAHWTRWLYRQYHEALDGLVKLTAINLLQVLKSRAINGGDAVRVTCDGLVFDLHTSQLAEQRKRDRSAKRALAAAERARINGAALPVVAPPVVAPPVVAPPVVAPPVVAPPVAALPVAALPVAALPVAAPPVAALKSRAINGGDAVRVTCDGLVFDLHTSQLAEQRKRDRSAKRALAAAERARINGAALPVVAPPVAALPVDALPVAAPPVDALPVDAPPVGAPPVAAPPTARKPKQPRLCVPVSETAHNLRHRPCKGK